MRRTEKGNRRIIRLALLTLALLLALFGPGMAGGEENSRLDVTRTGADGTDTGDDWKAIQDALDTAMTQSGVEVYIPAGTYYLSNTLVIYSDTKLTLDANATLCMMKEGLVMLMNGGAQAGGYGKTQNITVSGGTWDGNCTSGNVKETLIYICHAQGVHLSGMTIKNCCGSHFIEFAAVSGGTIRNCKISNFVLMNGVDYSDLDSDTQTSGTSISSEAIQLDFALENTSGGAAPFDGTPCKSIEISGCTFSNCLSGVGNHHVEKVNQSITIKNNTFKQMRNTCVNVFAAKDVIIQGNTATDVRKFAYLYKTGENIQILGNTVSGSKNALDCYQSGGLTASGNTITGFEVPLRVVGCSAFTFAENKISGASSEAIRIMEQSSGGSVVSNEIKDCGLRGISSYGSSAKIEKNTIEGVTENGILVSGGSVTVDGNTVAAECPIGILFGNSDGDIINNTVTKSTDFNIRAHGSSKGTLSGNTYDIGCGIYNTADKMEQVYNGNKYLYSDNEPTSFTVYYHPDDQSAASEKTTEVSVGTETATLTISELGYSAEGKSFAGWKAYRRDTKKWRVIAPDETGAEKKSWEDEVPANGRYALYSDGIKLSDQVMPGGALDLYATWGTGWGTEDGEKVYYDDDGNKAIGVKVIDGKYYGFSREGYLLSGLQLVDGNTYYFDHSDNEAAVTGQTIQIKKGGKELKLTFDEQGRLVLPGDVNGDGFADGRDAVRLAKYLKDATVEISLLNSDVNGDQTVDEKDLEILLQYLSGDQKTELYNRTKAK